MGGYISTLFWSDRRTKTCATRGVGYLFPIANIAMFLWLVFWINEFMLIALLFITVTMITLIMAYVNLRYHFSGSKTNHQIFYMIHLPIRIYLAVTMLEFFHTTGIVFAWNYHSHWVYFAIFMHFVLFAIAISLIVILDDYVTALAIAYIILSFAIKQSRNIVNGSPHYTPVIGYVLFGLLLFSSVIINGFKKRGLLSKYRKVANRRSSQNGLLGFDDDEDDVFDDEDENGSFDSYSDT